MTATSPVETSRFLRLPLELREIIYRTVLSSSSAKRPLSDGYSFYKFDLALLLVNRQVHDEALHIFRRLHTFVKIATPWRETQHHAAIQGYVPMICVGPRAANFNSHHLLVSIDAPVYAAFGHVPEHFIIHMDDLPFFCEMWHYFDLSYPGLNHNLRLTLDLRDPYTPSYSEPRLPRALQSTLLSPFHLIKNLNSLEVHNPVPIPSIVKDLKSKMSTPYTSPQKCLEDATALKDAGNALLPKDPLGAIRKYEAAFLAIHIVVEGRRRSVWADAFFNTTIVEGMYEKQHAHMVRILLRVRLVANTIHAYNLLENYKEAHFWGMRSITIMREATESGEDEIMSGFVAAKEMGKIYYRTALAARALGDKDEARALLKVAQGYLPNDQVIKKELVALAPRI